MMGSMEWGSRGEGSLVVGGSRDGRGEGIVGVRRLKAVYSIRGWDEGVKKFHKMMPKLPQENCNIYIYIYGHSQKCL